MDNFALENFEMEYTPDSVSSAYVLSDSFNKSTDVPLTSDDCSDGKEQQNIQTQTFNYVQYRADGVPHTYKDVCEKKEKKKEAKLKHISQQEALSTCSDAAAPNSRYGPGASGVYFDESRGRHEETLSHVSGYEWNPNKFSRYRHRTPNTFWEITKSTRRHELTHSDVTALTSGCKQKPPRRESRAITPSRNRLEQTQSDVIPSTSGHGLKPLRRNSEAIASILWQGELTQGQHFCSDEPVYFECQFCSNCYCSYRGLREHMSHMRRKHPDAIHHFCKCNIQEDDKIITNPFDLPDVFQSYRSSLQPQFQGENSPHHGVGVHVFAKLEGNEDAGALDLFSELFHQNRKF